MSNDVFPDKATLTEALRLLFQTKDDHVSFEILDRKKNVHSSTYPSEIVRICVGGYSYVLLHCKYGQEDEDHITLGHRGGVEYEANVYEKLLAPAHVSAPRYFGMSKHDRTWLFLEYLEGALRVSRTRRGNAMQQAAAWLGTFHRDMESRVGTEKTAFLKRHCAQYYRQWAIRTYELTKPLHKTKRWIDKTCRRFSELAEELSTMPRTIVHGEFTTQNVLVVNEAIRPVDWESAAIGIGETDLAMFIDGHWPAELVRECKREYIRSRWRDEEYEQQRWALLFAEVYVQLRWLGDRREWTENEHASWRFERLRSIAEEAELI